MHNSLDPLSAIVRLPNHPGDASCKKVPPDASPNLAPPPQPLKQSGLKPHDYEFHIPGTDASPR